jgi:hypothetical protein
MSNTLCRLSRVRTDFEARRIVFYLYPSSLCGTDCKRAPRSLVNKWPLFDSVLIVEKYHTVGCCHRQISFCQKKLRTSTRRRNTLYPHSPIHPQRIATTPHSVISVQLTTHSNVTWACLVALQS